MTCIINASTTNNLQMSSDGSGIVKVQSNGVTTNALAWVNFNGTLSSTITPRANYNISSVTKNGTGDYTLNFTNALTDANYSTLASVSWTNTTSRNIVDVQSNNSGTVAPTTSTVRLISTNYSTGTAYDPDYVNAAIFGN